MWHNNQENSVIPPNISVIRFVEGDTCDNNQENSVIPPNMSVILSLRIRMTREQLLY